MPDEFVYVGDPMCSWCWGFVPSLHAIPGRYNLPLRVVVGGLAVRDSARDMTDKMAVMIGEHWHHVQEASGQPFAFGSLQRRGWLYDSEPACTAVVAMRRTQPALTLDYFARLQKAFYADGVDITSREPLEDLAVKAGVPRAVFAAALDDPDTQKETWSDFLWSHKSGIRGFPTLLIRDGEEWAIVTRGFLAQQTLFEGLDRWFATDHAS